MLRIRKELFKSELAAGKGWRRVFIRWILRVRCLGSCLKCLGFPHLFFFLRQHFLLGAVVEALASEVEEEEDEEEEAEDEADEDFL